MQIILKTQNYYIHTQEFVKAVMLSKLYLKKREICLKCRFEDRTVTK